jgi:integrase/recombinase XerD
MGGCAWSRTAPGPLEAHAVAFARWLADAGFSQSRIEKRLCQLGHLSGWLDIEGLRPDELTVEHQQRFIEARRTAGHRTWLSPHSLRVPIAALQEAGVLPAASVAPDGPVEQLLTVYRRYLAGELGWRLTRSIITSSSRACLGELEKLGGLELERLVAGDVSAFLAAECPKRSVTGARDLVKGLRGLLRYLHVTGVIGTPLQWSVPAVAYRRDHSLPRGLPPKAVARLLASCDRRRAVGRRDYAVLLLVSRLACVPARSPRSSWRTSTGVAASFRFAERARGLTVCRCPPTSAGRSSAICDTARIAGRGRCSCSPAHRTAR